MSAQTHIQHCQVWKKNNTICLPKTYTKPRLGTKEATRTGKSKHTQLKSTFSKEKSSYTSAMWQNIPLHFLGFSYFYCILHGACVSECETRQRSLQTVLSHRTTHHSPASSTFEAPWMEHAQWDPVNKLLVEALMAPCEAVHWPRVRPGTTSIPTCKQFHISKR